MATRDPQLLRTVKAVVEHIQANNPQLAQQLGVGRAQAETLETMARAQEIDRDAIAQIVHDRLGAVTSIRIASALRHSWAELPDDQRQVFLAVADAIVAEVV